MEKREIEELEKLCEAATPGPWQDYELCLRPNDRELVRAARTAVPKLIARMRELDQELHLRRTQGGDQRLHNLCEGLEQPLECGHDLSDWCDRCETCGMCDDTPRPFKAEIARLQQQITELQAELKRDANEYVETSFNQRVEIEKRFAKSWRGRLNGDARLRKNLRTQCTS